ncbi:MAG: hypothetical protein LUD12_12160 [Lachnospiraceae bacterium]|nr:hypothetical protein [Lachnospiraceae bacterium]
MTEIKDIEEKQLQLAYSLSREHGKSVAEKFSVPSIYTQWCKWWEQDFLMNGGIMPVISNEQLVSSKENVGAIQPGYIQYYNKVLAETSAWIIAHYDDALNGRENSDRFKTQLAQCRTDHYKALTELLQNSGYYVRNGASIHHPGRIGKYWLYKHGENMEHLYFAGTYEYTLDYINEALPA